jgi:hypothetical protein
MEVVEVELFVVQKLENCKWYNMACHATRGHAELHRDALGDPGCARVLVLKLPATVLV